MTKKPIEFNKLSEEAQLSIQIYNNLQDNYLLPSMGAPLYMGKDLNSLGTLFSIFDVPQEQHIIILEMINIIDEEPIKKSRDAAKKANKPKRALNHG